MLRIPPVKPSDPIALSEDGQEKLAVRSAEKKIPGFREHRYFFLVLFFALLNGLVFIFLLPPWQHYDEPGHFEYAWLIANRGRLPKSGEYDQAMRREVAASMIEHGFFRNIDERPNLLSQSEPVWIGVSQLDDVPLYYLTAAAPLRLLRGADVVVQLYAARVVSLGFFLLTLLAAYGLLRELLPDKHPLIWMCLAALALLPAFVDLMTAVNNDVAVTACFTLFLWAGVRLICRGWSLARFIAVMITAVLAALSKNIGALALPLAVVPLVFALTRNRPGDTRRTWAVLVLFLFLALIFPFKFGDSAHWLRRTEQEFSTQTDELPVPLGREAFLLSASPEKPDPQIIQVLPANLVKALRGKNVTLGGWLWADRETTAQLPSLTMDNQPTVQTVEVGVEPQFFAYQARVPAGTNQLMISIEPSPSAPEQEVHFYLDGLVLTTGRKPLAQSPKFDRADGKSGIWGGREFTNLLQNGSAEQAWPWIRPEVNNIVYRYLPIEPALALAALLDPSIAEGYYRETAIVLFQTFWGRFGWGHIPLANAVYIFLAIVTAVGILGFTWFLWLKRRSLSWQAAAFLGLAIGSVWGIAILRGVHSIAGPTFIPAARYTYPVIVPTLLLLATGWFHIIRVLARRLNHLPSWLRTAVYLSCLLALDLLSIATIVQYYTMK